MTIAPNLSNLDRAVRVVVAAVCIYLGFFGAGFVPNHLVAMIIGFFGVVNLVAAATSRCPVYAACGLNTRKKEPVQT